MFITLEGGEGSGKSSVAVALADRLQSAGRPAMITHEPGGTDLGRRIWQFFQGPESPPITPLAELLLFEAARAQNVEKVIRPALAMDNIVVCDRFADSSVAYQAFGRGLARSLVDEMNHVATGGLRPNLTLLLDVPVEIGLERARAGRGMNAAGADKTDDSIGEESLQFHLRVHGGFQEIARGDPDRVVVIDASRPLDAVVEACWNAAKEVCSIA